MCTNLVQFVLFDFLLVITPCEQASVRNFHLWDFFFLEYDAVEGYHTLTKHDFRLTLPPIESES